MDESTSLSLLLRFCSIYDAIDFVELAFRFFDNLLSDLRLDLLRIWPLDPGLDLDSFCLVCAPDLYNLGAYST